MTTLLAIIRSGGKSQRCDARCYEAEEAECVCICGGVNHAKGLEAARENTRQLVGGWLANARTIDPEIDHVEIDLAVQSAVLF